MMKNKRKKLRKKLKGSIKGKQKGGKDMNLGDLGMKDIENERVKERKIEEDRREIKSKMKSEGRVWIRILNEMKVN